MFNTVPPKVPPRPTHSLAPTTVPVQQHESVLKENEELKRRVETLTAQNKVLSAQVAQLQNTMAPPAPPIAPTFSVTPDAPTFATKIEAASVVPPAIPADLDVVADAGAPPPPPPPPGPPPASYSTKVVIVKGQASKFTGNPDDQLQQELAAKVAARAKKVASASVPNVAAMTNTKESNATARPRLNSVAARNMPPTTEAPIAPETNTTTRPRLNSFAAKTLPLSAAAPSELELRMQRQQAKIAAATT